MPRFSKFVKIDEKVKADDNRSPCNEQFERESVEESGLCLKMYFDNLYTHPLQNCTQFSDAWICCSRVYRGGDCRGGTSELDRK